MLGDKVVFIMGEDRKLNLVFIEKFKDIDDPVQRFSLANAFIKRSLNRYLGHSTRAYRVDDTVFVATNVIVKLDDSVKFEVIPKTSAMIKRYRLFKFGKGPSLKINALSVSYMIYDSRQLHLDTQRGAPEAKELRGEPLLNLAGKLFKFKEMSFPMTQVLYGVGHAVTESTRLNDNPSSCLALKADFVQPDWFRQAEGSRITSSGTSVPEIFKLSFAMTFPPEAYHAETTIRLSKLEVELQELIWYVKDTGEYLWHLRKRSLLSTSFANVKLNSYKKFTDTGVRMSLPASFYQCKIPKVGPTFFTSDISRCFAIQFTAEVILGGSQQEATLKSFQELSVAEETYHTMKRYLPDEFPFLKLSRPFSLLKLQMFSLDGMQPEVIARRSLREALHSARFPYAAHQTDVFTMNSKAYVVSWIDVQVPCQQDIEGDRTLAREWKQQMIQHHGSPPIYRRKYLIIICEVVRASEIFGESSENTQLRGGLFLNMQGERQNYSFPFHSAPFTYSTDLKRNVCDLLFPPEVPSFKTYMSLTASFESHTRFKQAQDANIVLPGMSLSEFLVLELSTPMSTELLQSLGYGDLDREFIITGIDISVAEVIIHFNWEILVKCRCPHKILQSRTPYSFKWSQFRAESEDRRVVKSIPAHLFGCLVPNYGPTFFTNHSWRTYELIIKITIKDAACRKSMVFKVRQEINIATLERDGWEEASSSYDASDTE